MVRKKPNCKAAKLWLLQVILIMTIFSTGNGLAQNPQLVKDLIYGPLSSSPYGMIKMSNDKLLFFSQVDNYHDALWITNGTNTGTTLLKKFYNYQFPALNVLFRFSNQRVIFSAPDSLHGIELWVTDGTVAGTTFLKDINPGLNSSYIKFGPKINGRVLFIARTSGDLWSLWSTNGTINGTAELASSINTGEFFPDYDFIYTVYNGSLFFYAYRPALNVIELWRSDGTLNGTFPVKTLDLFFPAQGDFAVYHNLLFFHGYDLQHGEEVWKSNGSFSGTHLLRDINSGAAGSNPITMTVYNGLLYFVARDVNYGNEIWVSNGTAAGTQLFKDINPSLDDGADYIMGVAPPYLYFAGRDNVHGADPWRTDGTIGGTVFLKDCLTLGSVSSFPNQLMAVNDSAYFTAITDKGEFEEWGLFKTDGTFSGTTLIYDPGSASIYDAPTMNQFIYAQGNLYFRSQNTDGYFELTKSNSISTQQYDFLPDDDDAVSLLLRDGPVIYLAINRDPTIGTELYKLDITQPIQKSGDAYGSSNFLLYPDPVSTQIHLHFQSPAIEREEVQIIVRDISGNIAFQTKTFANSDQLNYHVLLGPELHNGYYIAEIRTMHNSYRQPFMLIR